MRRLTTTDEAAESEGGAGSGRGESSYNNPLFSLLSLSLDKKRCCTGKQEEEQVAFPGSSATKCGDGRRLGGDGTLRQLTEVPTRRAEGGGGPRVSSLHCPPTHQSHCCCQARLLVDEELLLPGFLLTAAPLVAAPAPAVAAAATGGGEPGHQNLKPSVGMDALGSNW